MSFKVKRVYDPPAARDGMRLLVDRMWPRGLAKERARVDDWQRDIAPSTALRQWFAHDASRWDEFRNRYFAELSGQADAVDALRKLGERRTVTLLFGAKDEAHNNAIALRDYLTGKRRRGPVKKASGGKR